MAKAPKKSVPPAEPVVPVEVQLELPLTYTVVLHGQGPCHGAINGKHFSYKRGVAQIVPPEVYYVLRDAGEIKEVL